MVKLLAGGSYCDPSSMFSRVVNTYLNTLSAENWPEEGIQSVEEHAESIIEKVHLFIYFCYVISTTIFDFFKWAFYSAKICILADNEKWIVKGFWFWLAYQSSPIFPFCIYVRKSVEWKKERSETRPTLAYWSIIGIINILSFISYRM